MPFTPSFLSACETVTMECTRGIERTSGKEVGMGGRTRGKKWIQGAQDRGARRGGRTAHSTTRHQRPDAKRSS